ncbi:hypothetical protein ASPNIDRAFT_35913 [Aspergillus niger ATCC 1015]|uniref:Uncharacterized protein n=1 Tax=Aspergillus niger (strain ATCC 1015 / CBS 113.46 / FGSC A1144 / LSHB Ac4 / NCTC 3858a / NRRL 328 / USDA 3528.7) TaxID=380704 RepID=G3XT39_ASPNA|nr:hypothetical protein ASPNIDRAFT_35913 [Aspergillus niger ATCC 1015]
MSSIESLQSYNVFSDYFWLVGSLISMYTSGTGGLNLATILIGQDVFTSTSVHVAGRFLLAACFTTSSSSIQDTLSAANETIPLGLRSSLPRSHCILFPCVDAVNLKMTKCWNISGWTRLAGPFRVMLIPCLCGFAVNDLN